MANTISRNNKVVIVDDDPFILNMLDRLLTRLGYENVISFNRASDVINHYESVPPEPDEIVISDLQMPEMDGVELVRKLGNIGFRGNLMLLSGEDNRTLQAAANLAKSQKLRLLGALTKPMAVEKLRVLLNKASGFSLSNNRKNSQLKAYAPEEVKQAIEREELINFYQPKVSLTNGKVVGVESLVRWQHPRDGLVFPDQFINVAENNDLMDAMTKSVLKIAIQQAREWERDDIFLKVSVNVSMENLCSLEFPDMVSQVLGDTGLYSESLILEVTESRLMQDSIKALDILTRLRLRRVKLSIDDFGTGHSSLAQLRDLPFDELKLDRGFVCNASKNPQRRAILEASIAMADRLGMTTVAEGIENQEDWDFLRDLGCDQVQGYFIAKPMPARELTGWLQDWEQRRKTLSRAA